jgi:5-methylcytosine-specific restriction enzyme subunit McrC
LDRGYQPHQEDIGTVRGRIALNETILLKARHAPRLSCHFDELTANVLHNQILKATMSRLSRLKTLDRQLAHELRALARRFNEVQDVPLSRNAFGRVMLHRNNAYYDLILKVCRLAFDLMLPDQKGDGFQFHDILRDERKMAAVFRRVRQKFLSDRAESVCSEAVANRVGCCSDW